MAIVETSVPGNGTVRTNSPAVDGPAGSRMDANIVALAAAVNAVNTLAQAGGGERTIFVDLVTVSGSGVLVQFSGDVSSGSTFVFEIELEAGSWATAGGERTQSASNAVRIATSLAISSASAGMRWRLRSTENNGIVSPQFGVIS